VHIVSSLFEFFDQFSGVSERVSTYPCPLVLLGDVNLHLDIADDRSVWLKRNIITGFTGADEGEGKKGKGAYSC